MGKSGLKHTALMVGSAICGCISPIACLGAVEAAGRDAISFLPAGEFVRIELPPPLAAPVPTAAPTAADEVLLAQPAAPQEPVDTVEVQYAASPTPPGVDETAFHGYPSGIGEAAPKKAPAAYSPYHWRV